MECSSPFCQLLRRFGRLESVRKFSITDFEATDQLLILFLCPLPLSVSDRPTVSVANKNVCDGECITGLFSFFCERIDRRVRCSNGGRCCLRNRPQRRPQPEPTKPPGPARPEQSVTESSETARPTTEPTKPTAETTVPTTGPTQSTTEATKPTSELPRPAEPVTEPPASEFPGQTGRPLGPISVQTAQSPGTAGQLPSGNPAPVLGGLTDQDSEQ